LDGLKNIIQVNLK